MVTGRGQGVVAVVVDLVQAPIGWMRPNPDIHVFTLTTHHHHDYYLDMEQTLSHTY